MKNKTWLLLAIALCAAVPHGTAGVITAFGSSSLPGFSTGTIGPVGATPAPNNDNASAASPNVINYSIFFNTFGMLEAEFLVDDSGGTTEYRIVQSFLNNTGLTWSGFQFELGFGTGSSFVRSPAGDGLDFDTPDADPAPTSTRFPMLVHTEDTIDWSGALVPAIGGSPFTFAVDVPDGITRFTIRQTPAAVPEPSSFALMLGGLTAALWSARRRSRAR